MAVCAGSAAVAALPNCIRVTRKSTDVTADSVIADYANNVIEDFRRSAIERGMWGGAVKDKRQSGTLV